MKIQFEKFKKNLRDKNFYDAHEDLEELWFPKRFEKTNEVLFLKGLINSAVCFELFKQNKIPQANKVWKNYLKYKDLINHLEEHFYYNEFCELKNEVEKIFKNKLYN